MARRTGDGPATPATLALDRAGIAYVKRAYEHDPRATSFGLEAAAALGVDPARVYKTLVADNGGTAGSGGGAGTGLVVGIIPVSAMLDLKALAGAVGRKALVMADPAAAQRSSGYVVGGISPIGQRRALPTVLDESALAFDTVLVSGGRRGFDLELSPADLVDVTAALTASIVRG